MKNQLLLTYKSKEDEFNDFCDYFKKIIIDAYPSVPKNILFPETNNLSNKYLKARINNYKKYIQSANRSQRKIP